MRASTAITWLLWLQGGYYLLSALWPLVSMRTFEHVTGPKTDHWLVKTVSALIAVIAGVLLLAASRGAASPEIALLATGSAAALAAVDTIVVLQRRIGPVYLLDALAECLLLTFWIFFWFYR